MNLADKACSYLDFLCNQIPNRCVGNAGNVEATHFFQERLAEWSWNVESSPFEAMSWHTTGASLSCDGVCFDVFSSPYALGCQTERRLSEAHSVEALEHGNFQNTILLLHGELAKEQLIPKNFVFYQSPLHQRILAALESCGAAALICATERNASMAGGVYPFPLIEDGDFSIPSVFMKDVEGKQLLSCVDKTVHLYSGAVRGHAVNHNVLGRKGRDLNQRIVVSAHIDAKQGTPGALDNGVGVVVLLLLAELLQAYDGERCIELLALNGEDYYAVPGQMLYLRQNKGKFADIKLNINVDCAGYRNAPTAFSPMNLPDETLHKLRRLLSSHAPFIEGTPWYQGDHSLFLQNGCPAIAVASQWFLENIESQDVTHTTKDAPDIVDCQLVAEIATGIWELLQSI